MGGDEDLRLRGRNTGFRFQKRPNLQVRAHVSPPPPSLQPLPPVSPARQHRPSSCTSSQTHPSPSPTSSSRQGPLRTSRCSSSCDPSHPSPADAVTQAPLYSAKLEFHSGANVCGPSAPQLSSLGKHTVSPMGAFSLWPRASAGLLLLPGDLAPLRPPL